MWTTIELFMNLVMSESQSLAWVPGVNLHSTSSHWSLTNCLTLFWFHFFIWRKFTATFFLQQHLPNRIIVRRKWNIYKLLAQCLSYNIHIVNSGEWHTFHSQCLTNTFTVPEVIFLQLEAVQKWKKSIPALGKMHTVLELEMWSLLYINLSGKECPELHSWC
jgi:hypothetical protein